MCLGPCLRPKHAVDWLSLCLSIGHPRHALDDTWFLHQRRIEFRRYSADHRSNVAREPRTWRSCCCSSPEMIARVGEEVGTAPAEQACPASVLLTQDDLIEQLDVRIVWLRSLSLVDEFVERLRLLQHVDVFNSIMRQRALKPIPVELPKHALFLLLRASRSKVAAVCVQ